MKQNIISEEPLCMAEVKHVLEAVKKKEGELNFRAQKTLEHLETATRLSFTKSKELMKKISELSIPRMRDQHVKKLVDTLPTTEKDAKVVLSGFNVTFTNDHLKSIVGVTKEYVNA